MGAWDAQGAAPELEHHRVAVAFDYEPEVARIWCADAAALVGLKSEAFGRARHDGKPVDRDFADVVLLLEHLLDDIAAQVEGDGVMRARIINAARTLLEKENASLAAVRELTLAGAYDTAQAARQATRRAATRALRLLDR